MLYNEYLSEEDSYILKEKKEKKKINYRYINFVIITLLLTILNFDGNINPFPYIMIGLASTFSIPLILVYLISLIGMFVTGNSISAFVIFTIFFAFFSIFTSVVNIEGISRKYVNLIKMSISMLVVKLIAMFFTEITLTFVLYETVIAAILFVVLVTGIYVVFNIKKGHLFSNEELIAALILFALIISNLSSITIYNVSVMNILIITITMIYGWKSSSIIGAVAGLSLGMVATIVNDFNISFIVIMAFSGMLAGMFKKFGKVAVIIGFVLGTIIVSMLLTSSSYITANIIEMLIASLVLLFIPKKISNKLDDIFSYDNKLNMTRNNLITGKVDVDSKLASTAIMFKDLANISLPITKESKEETREVIKRYIVKYAEDNCIDCKNKKECINEDNLNIAVDNISTKLERLEEIKDDLLVVKCDKSSKIVKDIEELNNSIKISRLLKKKEEENSIKMAKQYKEISNIISKLSKEVSNNNYKKHKFDAKLLREELKILGFVVYEDELIIENNGYIEYVFVTDILNDIDKQKEAIVNCLSTILEKQVNIKLILNLSKTEKSKIKIVSKSYYKVTNVAYIGVKDKEVVSGDNYTILNELKNKYISILSDGVGSSSSAYNSSKNITNMLQKLLNGGFEEESAVEIINNIINLSQAENNFATLDMCIIDLDTLVAEFVKLGAAPTYILSGSKVSTISNHNVPVGLLGSTDYVPISKKLKINDIIIQISDGIISDDENKIDNYFVEILKKVDYKLNKKEILEFIKNEIFKIKGDILKDDSTIIIHRINKNK